MITVADLRVAPGTATELELQAIVVAINRVLRPVAASRPRVLLPDPRLTPLPVDGVAYR